MARPAARQPLGLYDTTLRDGAQAEGVRFSVHDKIALASALADFGMEWIEAGWPGAIPTDDEFFAAAPSRLSPDARRRLVAFGRTVKHGVDPADDSLMQALLGCGAPSVCIVAKASESQVVRSLRLLPSHNLDMIATSVRHLKAGGVDSVFVDAEHFFDGYKACPAYSMAVVRRAMEAGADGVVLCDTNGGSMPWEVEAACRAMGFEGDWRLGDLSELSQMVGDVSGLQPARGLPYVGRSAFAHKGGLHIAAQLRDPAAYQHVDPELVGNSQRLLVSEQAGAAAIRERLAVALHELNRMPRGLTHDVWNPTVEQLRNKIKELSMQGARFEDADATVELLLRREMPGYLAPFRVQRYDLSHSSASGTTATISLELPEAGCEWCTVDGSRDPHAHLTRVGVGLATALDPTKAIWGALLDGLKKAYGTELDGVRLLRHSHIYLPADGDKDQVLATIDVATGGSGREQSCETVAVGASAIDAALVAIADAIEYAVLDGTPLCILPEQEENGFISQKAPQEPRGGVLRVSTSTYSI